MNTKTCTRCDWVYPVTTRRAYCIFCGGALPGPVCAETKAANNLRSAKRYRLADKDTAELYDNWKQMIAKIPEPYTYITNDQWLETCAHFKGCALCGEDETGNRGIDARGYFITPQEGGKYCVWNVIPMCEYCATAQRTQPNLFRMYNTRLGKKGMVGGIKTYKRIIGVADYLLSKIPSIDKNE